MQKQNAKAVLVDCKTREAKVKPLEKRKRESGLFQTAKRVVREEEILEVLQNAKAVSF